MADYSSIGAILSLAILTEATVQIFLKDIPLLNKLLAKICKECAENQESILRWLSVFIGVGYAFNMGLDLFTLLGFPSKIPGIGTIAAGLIASRGIDYIKNLIEKISTRKETII